MPRTKLTPRKAKIHDKDATLVTNKIIASAKNKSLRMISMYFMIIKLLMFASNFAAERSYLAQGFSGRFDFSRRGRWLAVPFEFTLEFGDAF